MPNSTEMLHVYAFTRNGDCFYIGGPSTLDKGIPMALLEIKKRQRPYVRATVEDVRANTTIWQSPMSPRP